MASGIDYLAVIFITIIYYRTLKGTFYGGIIVLAKFIIEILKDKRGFACQISCY